MEEMNELRYYLRQINDAVRPQCDGGEPLFKPTYLVTAVKLPNGAIELAVNNQNISEKIDYILEAYDKDMHLKTNPDIVMSQLMVV